MKTEVIFFSPTGTSASVAMAAAKGVGGEISVRDITFCHGGATLDLSGCAAVFAVPVYAGRVPAVCADRLKKISGNGVPAAVAVVYGNRDYEDALVELTDIVTAAGFNVVAAGAFVGEHSYSTDERPVAQGRPDGEDIAKAGQFGRDFAAKLAKGDMSTPAVKGNRPYKDRSPKRNVTPQTDETLCGACGTCADACPTCAITVDGVSSSDAAKCIMCCACVKKCPVFARYINDEGIDKIRAFLFANFTARREPEIFI